MVDAADETVFLTLVRRGSEVACARVLIESIRLYGGALSDCPIWLFQASPQIANVGALGRNDVQILPLALPETVKGSFFADKVFACARAEEMVSPRVRSLVWIDPVCLVIRPPLMLSLGRSVDAAVRPVHIRNVGLHAEGPLDRFWKGICMSLGARDIRTYVETFVEGERIRSYFNSHAFAVDPSRRLLGRWFERFEALVCNKRFQDSTCQDELHRVFLHQAVFSALLVTELEPERIRILPPEYNYPYNLHGSVPVDRQASVLNDLVTIAYENRSLDPDTVDDIDILEPLRSWLSDRVGIG